MYNLISLQAKNLFSYQNLDIDFKTNQLTTIHGINETDLGVESNGSGKSSILDIIAIAITGDSLKSLSKKDIIRNGEKQGTCSIEFLNMLTKKFLRIETEINSTSSNKIRLYEDGELNTKLKDLNPTETYKEIYEIFDITRNDLLNYFLVSKENYQSLFLSTDATKKEIINRFSKANMIDAIKPLIDVDIAKQQGKLYDENECYAAVEAKINLTEEKLKQVVENFESDKENKINTILDSCEEKTQQQDRLNNKILEGNNLIKKNEEEISKIKTDKEEKQIKDIDKKIEDLSEKRSKKLSEYNQIQNQFSRTLEEIEQKRFLISNGIDSNYKLIRETTEKISGVEKVLAGEIKCPKCGESFLFKPANSFTQKNESFDIKIDDLKKDLITYNNLNKTLNKDIEKYRVDLEKNKTKKEEVNNEIKSKQEKIKLEGTKLKTDIEKLEEDRRKLKHFIDNQKREIKTTNDAIEVVKDDIEKIGLKVKSLQNEIDQLVIDAEKEQEKTIDEVEKPFKEDLSVYGEELLRIQEDRNIIEDEIAALTECNINFKQFKTYLANTSISSIESLCNYYLDKMNTNLSVLIDGFRELSNKKMKEEITISVSRDGLTGENFKKFSGGEKAKSDLSSILAMQQLINLNSSSGGLNLIAIDEILESLDPIAFIDATKALNNVGKTILLISHIDHQRLVDCNKIIVKKVNKISQIQ